MPTTANEALRYPLGTIANDFPQAMQELAEDAEDRFGLTTTTRTTKDANGIFTVVEFRRPNGTLRAKSTLSGGTSPSYTTRTIVEYAADGTTARRTTTLTLAYDGDGDLISETVA